MTEKNQEKLIARGISENIDRVKRLSQEADSRFSWSEDMAVISTVVERGELPKVVIVGDNPGMDEYKDKVYFSAKGRAGRMARAFFDTIYGPNSFRTSVAVFNKSSFHTNRTNGLVEFCSNGEFLKDGIENARLIAVLALSGVPIVFLGLETNPKIFFAFRSEFIKITKDRNVDVRVVPHFSLSKIFSKNSSKEWNRKIDLFTEKWKQKYPDIVTENGNVSSKAFFQKQDKSMVVEYYEHVILG